jgi:hypothetical protein
MKTIEGLKNMKSISRGALIKALQGKYVALVGLIHIPYDENDWDDNNLDETVVARLQTLEGQIEEFRKEHHEYKNTGLFRKTSQGYKRGDSCHWWQKGDYCLVYLGVYVVVTGHVIMLLTAE